MDNSFSSGIYQQGKRIYLQGKVKNISIINNTVKAFVSDNGTNAVKLVYNQSKELVSKSCTCAYAKYYHECKHMAALCVYVQNNSPFEKKEQTLRDLYEVYVTSKPRPLVKNYSDFEYQIQKQLKLFLVGNDFELIKKYAASVPTLGYPIKRIEKLYNCFNNIIYDYYQKDSQTVLNWIKKSFINRDYKDFNDFFIKIIKDLEPTEIKNICEDLVFNHSKQLDSYICNQLFMIYYDIANKTLDEILDKYFAVEPIEAFYVIRIKEYLNNGQYDNAIKVYKEHCRRFPNGIYREQIDEYYKNIAIIQNPDKYLTDLIRKMPYWNPDLTEFKKIIQILGNEWENCKYTIIPKIRDRFTIQSYKAFLELNKEIDYVEKLLLNEPTKDNYEIHESILRKFDPNNAMLFFFDMINYELKSSSQASLYKYIVEQLEIIKSKDPQAYDYMAFYIRENFPRKKNLIAMIDELEDIYEN